MRHEELSQTFARDERTFLPVPGGAYLLVFVCEIRIRSRGAAAAGPGRFPPAPRLAAFATLPKLSCSVSLAHPPAPRLAASFLSLFGAPPAPRLAAFAKNFASSFLKKKGLLTSSSYLLPLLPPFTSSFSSLYSEKLKTEKFSKNALRERLLRVRKTQPYPLQDKVCRGS